MAYVMEFRLQTITGGRQYGLEHAMPGPYARGDWSLAVGGWHLQMRVCYVDSPTAAPIGDGPVMGGTPFIRPIGILW